MFSRHEAASEVSSSLPIVVVVLSISALLSCRNFQQFYQTFFHGSFRVSNYMAGDAGLRDLLAACHGIKVRLGEGTGSG